MIHLGLVTYMWGAEWDLPTIIKNCEAAGWTGVELRTTHKHGVEIPLSEQQRKDVAKRFADSRVQLVGLGTACEYQAADAEVVKKNIEETKAFIRLCHDVGGSGVKVRPNGLPKGVDPDKTLAQIGAALDEVAAYGEGYGVQIRLEIHGAGTALLPNIKKIMDASHHKDSRLCWNCNPEDTQGHGLEANFNLVKDRLGATIHVHDLISSYPWQQFFDLLVKNHYDGWTLVEEGTPTSDPVRVMTYHRLLWERMTQAKA